MKRLNRSKVIISILIIMTGIGINGCRNYAPIEPTVKTNFTDLSVDQDFKFETTREIDLHIEVITTNPLEAPHKFSIYDNDPSINGKLISSGITDPYFGYETKIKIPSYLNQIYIVNEYVNNESETVVVDATGNSIYYSFNSGVSLKNTFKSTNDLYSDPGCSSCDEIIASGTYNTKDINNNTTYCIEAGSNVTITNKFNFKGGNLFVCGTITVNKFQVNNNGGDFVLSSGAVMSLTNGNIDKDFDNFIIFGTASVAGNTVIKDMNFENQGTFNIGGSINIQTENFHNSGSMSVAGHFNNNEEGVNTGTITVGGHFNNNGGTEFTNECKLIISGNFNQNELFHNAENAYVEVAQNTTLSGNTTTNMAAQSLISTTNLTINSDLIGPSASCARIDVSSTTNINGNGNVSGHIDICDSDGIENNNGTVSDDVTFDCSCYVPTTNCNPGSGQPTNPDSDGDGCPDDQDDYPNDPLRCSNDFYPNETDFTSLAMEDLWSNYGDYDFNDLVIMTNYKTVKNAQNEIVELYGKFHIAAVGASMNNGFGIEFEIPSSLVDSVSGIQINGSAVSYKDSGIEDGPVNKAVLIVYDAISSYLGSSMVNTIPGGNDMDIDTIEVYMKLTSPQTTIGTPPYNPFMFISQNRGKEIHLIDHAPTELVNTTFFGEGVDDSDPGSGRYYVSATNLPWVIEVPTSFEWPKENADILSAYLKFQQWAESSGQQYTDWYQDEPGYRDNDNIY